MGTAYYGTGFVGKMGLERKTISEEELYYAAEDKPDVVKSVQALVDGGAYPENLW